MGYKSITGEALAEGVAAALPAGHVVADRALHVAPDHVLLAAGGRLDARHVIDARGAGNGSALTCGWQKFVGQALTVRGGRGLTRPVVMDATVEQGVGRGSWREGGGRNGEISGGAVTKTKK